MKWTGGGLETDQLEYVPMSHPRDTTTTREPRKPLLSAADIYARKDDAAHYEGIGDETERDRSWLTGFEAGAVDARAFYENLITSGELMVVKTAHWTKSDRKENKCSACGWVDDDLRNEPSRDFDHCPSCGARIIP